MNEFDIISRFTCWLYNYQVLNAAQMLGYLYFILSSAASSYPIKHQNDKGFSFIHLDLCKNLIIIHLLIFFQKLKLYTAISFMPLSISCSIVKIDPFFT